MEREERCSSPPSSFVSRTQLNRTNAKTDRDDLAVGSVLPLDGGNALPLSLPLRPVRPVIHGIR